ncbi:hypothetical protein [Cohnella cellulosilytica]|uniref:Heparinase II/III-like protein n=1 Tax=Cohnella cellulosilytica TaxID=986710 RepID=A0ABW2F9B4_9BACL
MTEGIGRSAEELYYSAGESAAGFWARAARAPEFSGMAAELRAEGVRLLEEPVPALTEELFSIFARTGSRLEFERAYFQRRRRLNAFALLSLLEPAAERYYGKLLETLRTILEERTWCLPAHVKGTDAAKTIDLFSAETGFALSEIACLLGDRLPPELTEGIDRAVARRLIGPLLRDGPHHWETARHNWAAVCAGSVGAAALLRTTDAETLEAVLAKVLPALDCYLDGFGEDGACPEGLGYWNYGFGYYVYFADLLAKRTGGRIDLFAKPKVRSIALFQQAAYLCGDRVACFSDSLREIPFRTGLTHYLARMYSELETPDARYEAGLGEDHCHRWAPALRDWLWRDSRTAASGGLRPASRYFPDAQWLLSRCVSEAGRCFGFAAKGGHNDEPHNHNDIGQFMWMVDGTAFAADLGSGEYTSAYFGADRYAYDCNGSQGHSVPIVDGRGQEAGRAHAATVLEAAAGESEDALRLDLRRAYRAPGLASLVRELRWRKAGECRLTLTDEVAFEGEPLSFTERIVTFAAPDLTEDGTVRLTSGGLTALIRYDGALLEVSAERRVYSDHFGEPQAWYAIDWKLRRPNSANRIELVFELGDGNEPKYRAE